MVAKIFHRSATGCTKSNSTKQHSWQIVSNGNAVNYRWLLIFPPDLAKKTQVWTLSKHSMVHCIWKHDMKSSCEQPHFIWKNTVKSTPWLQEQQTAVDTHDMSSQSTLFQAGQTPPAEPTWCKMHTGNDSLLGHLRWWNDILHGGKRGPWNDILY